MNLQRKAAWVLLFGVLLLAVHLAIPYWPTNVIFSDLLDIYESDIFFPSSMTKIAISMSLAGTMLVGLVAFSRSQHPVRALTVFNILVLMIVALYPQARSFALHRFAARSPPFRVVIEAGHPTTGEAWRLQISEEGRPFLVSVPTSVGWFAEPVDCKVTVDDAGAILEVLRDSDFFMLPRLLEIEGTLGHDWMRISFVGNDFNFSVVGLRSGGWHSDQFRRVEEALYQELGVERDPATWPCL